jgi:nucleotide-binding universal stress UspA family protein
MIKDMLVNLTVGAKQDVVSEFAASVAKTFEARLTATAFVYIPYVPGSVFEGAVAEIVQTQAAEAERAAKAAVAGFEQAAKRYGIAAESRVLNGGLESVPVLFGRIARRFDIAVVGQPERDAVEPARSILEAALFDSGRPILIVPYIQKEPLALDHVMVGWDGSRSAARAIGDAMPFLKYAKAVEVITVSGEPAKSDELPGADIAHHLARHGLKVEVDRQVVRDVDVSSTILSRAADKGSDLIVMGGYGHSRLREFVLGGATRGILASMTVPILMSH